MVRGFLKVKESTLVGGSVSQLREWGHVPGQGAEIGPRPREYDTSQGKERHGQRPGGTWGRLRCAKLRKDENELRAPGKALLQLRKPSPNTRGSVKAHLRDLGDPIVLGEAST